MSLSDPNFQHGKNLCLYYNGIDLSEFFNTVGFTKPKATADSTAFRNQHLKRLSGHKDSAFTSGGFWDGDERSADEILDRAVESDQEGVVNVLWGNDVIGRAGAGSLLVETAYDVETTHDGVVATSLEAESNVGRDRVRVLHPKASVTATGVGTAVQYGSASPGITTNFGGVGYQQLFSVTGTGTFDNEIHESTDAFAMNDDILITFDSVADTDLTDENPGQAQRKVAATTTDAVGGQTRVDFTLTGITAAEFFTGFKRGKSASDYETEEQVSP